MTGSRPTISMLATNDVPIRVVYAATRGCGDVLPGLLVRTMSGSTVQQMSGSELISVASATTADYEDAM